jgi:hypothetical protein
VTVCVDAEEGSFVSYIDGQECSRAEDVDADALVLRHQVVVFGGGKQAQARGGHLHRLLIHDRALDAAQVLDVYKDSASTLETHVLWLCPDGQAINEPAKAEFEQAGFKVNVKTSFQDVRWPVVGRD